MDGRNFRFRFSLRTLLLVVTALCIGPGGWLADKREQTEAHRQARRELERLRIGFGGSLDLQGNETGPRPYQPAWERLLFGDDLSSHRNVLFLMTKNPQTLDKSLEQCPHLPNLYWLCLDQSVITDEGLARCERLTQVEMLSLSKTQISDAGLVHLSGLTNLRKIDLRETLVTDEGVTNLQRALPRLEIYR